MSGLDGILLLAVAAGVVLAIRSMLRRRKRGGCCGCGNCSGCSGCGADRRR
jgi:hypothetical protein